MEIINVNTAKMMDVIRTATYSYNDGNNKVIMTKKIDGKLVDYAIGFNTVEEAKVWFNKHILSK